LNPAAVCAIPVVTPVCISGATAITAGVVALGAGAITYFSGAHRRAVERTTTDLAIAAAHIGAAGEPPPDDNWLKDKLDDAQKHLNNARQHVQRALGRQRRELERQIDALQRLIDTMRPSQ
jgi:hypothetical protein